VIDHPVLRDPSRRSAFAKLLAHPIASRQEWATLLGWTESRVQRFLAALERAGLVVLEKSKWGTAIRARTVPERQPDGSISFGNDAPDPYPIQDRTETDPRPITLGCTALGKSLGLGARLDEKVEQQEPLQPEADNFTAACIDTMNEQLARIFGEHYRRVKYDNLRSGLACDRWKSAGVELEFAIEEIRKACLKFNPSHHGRGRLPGTLGYFERGVLEAHATRSQIQIPLPPVVQQGGQRAGADRQQPPRGGKPAPVGDFMSAYLGAGGKERRQ
jgi:hypothetical protein